MKRKTVRLTEAELKNVVRNSVYRILNENIEDEGKWGKRLGAAAIGAASLAGLHNCCDDPKVDPEEYQEYQSQREWDNLHPSSSPVDSMPLYERKLNRIVRESIRKRLNMLKNL